MHAALLQLGKLMIQAGGKLFVSAAMYGWRLSKNLSLGVRFENAQLGFPYISCVNNSMRDPMIVVARTSLIKNGFS